MSHLKNRWQTEKRQIIPGSIRDGCGETAWTAPEKKPVNRGKRPEEDEIPENPAPVKELHMNPEIRIATIASPEAGLRLGTAKLRPGGNRRNR